MGKSALCVRLTGFESPRPLYVRVDRRIKVPTLEVAQSGTAEPPSRIQIPLSVQRVNGRSVWSTEDGHDEFKSLETSAPFGVRLVEGVTPILDGPESITGRSWITEFAGWRERIVENREQHYWLTLPADSDLELARFVAPVVVAPGAGNVLLNALPYSSR